MYMDNIKLFFKNKKVLATLILAVRIFSHDIWIEFCIEKYAMIIMKRDKQHITEEMELPNQEKRKPTNTWE